MAPFFEIIAGKNKIAKVLSKFARVSTTILLELTHIFKRWHIFINDRVWDQDLLKWTIRTFNVSWLCGLLTLTFLHNLRGWEASNSAILPTFKFSVALLLQPLANNLWTLFLQRGYKLCINCISRALLPLTCWNITKIQNKDK